jgi:5-methylcytosine-specific restriction endonuclease McrA
MKKCKWCKSQSAEPSKQFCSNDCRMAGKEHAYLENKKKYKPKTVRCVFCKKERRLQHAKKPCKCTTIKRFEGQCTMCGTTVVLTPSKLKHRKNPMCSVECGQAWMKKNGEKSRMQQLFLSIGVCKVCGIGFKKTGCRKKTCKHCAETISKREREILTKKRKEELRAKKIAERPSSCVVCNKELKVVGHLARFKLYCSSKCYKTTPAYKASNRASRARRRARKAGAECEAVNPIKVFRRDNWTCKYCKCKVEKHNGGYQPYGATLDHVIPLSKGGRHAYDNIVTACNQCNSLKSDKVFTLF